MPRYGFPVFVRRLNIPVERKNQCPQSRFDVTALTCVPLDICYSVFKQRRRTKLLGSNQYLSAMAPFARLPNPENASINSRHSSYQAVMLVMVLSDQPYGVCVLSVLEFVVNCHGTGLGKLFRSNRS
jgi:hypothetical protein